MPSYIRDSGGKAVSPAPDEARSGHAPARAGASWGKLSTEASNPSSEDLDTRSTDEVVALLLDEDRRGLERAREHVESIARAATWAAEALANGGRVLFAGAGTSGRLGVLEAAECPPTFGTDPEQIQAVMAGGANAVYKAREGAEDVFEDGERSAEKLGEDDVLIGISASSATPYVRGALDAARRRGARTVLVTCTAGGELTELADLLIALDTGPEVLTGSTRLKAGSATKAVLNAITTAAMVRLGKVYGNLMVDVRPGSAKLRDRSLRIIQAAARVSREEAARLYEATGGEVKTAIVMARCGLDRQTARQRLGGARGHVRQALENSDESPPSGSTDGT